jgi:thioredoxin-like negative regulator of GroEL
MRSFFEQRLFHYMMDRAALVRAAALLESASATGPRIAGAAYMVLKEVLEELGQLSLERKIALFESSVAYEPDWIQNRQHLAWAYVEAGRLEAGRAQLHRALSNATKPVRATTATERTFEELITGRSGDRVTERLVHDLERLDQAPGGSGE